MRSACRDPDGYLAWLGAIARREALRLHATRRPTSELDEASAATDCEPADLVQTRLQLAEIVGGLADGERELLRLRYEDDLKYAEIAARLGTPVGTVKVRLHRLHARLRARLVEAECLPRTKTRD